MFVLQRVRSLQLQRERLAGGDETLYALREVEMRHESMHLERVSGDVHTVIRFSGLSHNRLRRRSCE